MSFFTFSFLTALSARSIVAMGVLNSCVILLMKSVFISEIFFCLIELKIVETKDIIITKVNTIERIIRKEIDDLRYETLFGKPITKEKFVSPLSLAKRGIENFSTPSKLVYLSDPTLVANSPSNTL